MRRTGRIGFGVTLCITLMAANGMKAQQLATHALGPPPGRRVTTLTPKAGYFNEPVVALDPVNNKRAVVAYQIRGNISYSEDGGTTWVTSADTVLNGFKAGADSSIAFNRKGQLIVCHIAFDKLGTENYWAHDATRNAIYVHRSIDFGKTWPGKPATVIAHPTEEGIDFEDKPFMIVDATNSRFSGNIYVGWTKFTLADSRMMLSMSSDGGNSWSFPAEIGLHRGGPRDDNGAVEGFTGAVDSDGVVYVSWADGTSLLVSSSHDGGATFRKPVVAAQIPASFYTIAGIDRASGFPSMAIDRKSHKLAISWADYRNGDVDVFLSTSADHGGHWSSPNRVNTDKIHNGIDQFYPALAIDQTDGSFNIIFYDRREDKTNKLLGVTLARSTDGGHRFVNYEFSEELFDPKGDFIGDYLGIAAADGKILGVWTREAKPGEPIVTDLSGKPSKLQLMVDVGSAVFR